jgi:hypothetical protein
MAELAKAMEELPTTVSENDLLRIELGQERAARLSAQKDALTLQINDIATQLKKAQDDLQALVASLSEKYKVTGQDSYDRTTGKITRQTPVP